MKQTGKTVITVLIILACIITSAAFILSFKINTDESGYRIAHHCEIEIRDVKIEKLGHSYQGQNSKIGDFYIIRYHVKNPSNVYLNTDDLYFYYKAEEEEENFRVQVYEDNTFFSYDNNQIIPACEEAEITRVIEVEDGCKEVLITYDNFMSSEKQEFHVSI